MLAVSAYDVKIDEDGWVVVTLLGEREQALPSRPARGDRGWPKLETTVLGEVAARFSRVDPADPTSVPDRIEQVSLRLAEGVTATTLQRFAWVSWLRIVDAYARTGVTDKTVAAQRAREDPGTAAMLDRAVFEERGIGVMAPAQRPERHGLPARPRSRPGRRGHGREHYEKIAKLYKDLVRQGERAPTKAITEMIRQHENKWVSRHTVAGWVKHARELGYLPPGRRGRPG